MNHGAGANMTVLEFLIHSTFVLEKNDLKSYKILTSAQV